MHDEKVARWEAGGAHANDIAYDQVSSDQCLTLKNAFVSSAQELRPAQFEEIEGDRPLRLLLVVANKD